MKTTNAFAITQVDRKPGLSQKEFIDNYLKPGIPVVIPGAMKDQWPAWKKWDPEYFRDQLGDKQVRVAGEKPTLRKFMESVMASTEEKPSHYLNEVNIHIDFPELLPDVEPFLSYALPDRLMTSFMPDTWGMRKGVVELLIGGKGTKFPTLHYDGFHMNTFVTQIRGDKEFILFSPDQTKYMYPLHEGSNKSLVNDVYNPDLNKFPLFAQARALKTTIYEGDTVFLPSGWWHTTRLLSLSIALSTNNVGAKQWNNFVDDFAKQLTASPLRQTVYKAYLKGAGSILDIAGK